MTNIVQNINTLDVIEIDSFKVRVPFEFVEILDERINDTIQTVSLNSGYLYDDVKVKNFFRTEKKDERGRILYNYKWAIEKKTLEKGRARKFLIIGVNAKKLETRYLEGITKDNIKLLYKGLMAQKVCKFSYKDFLNSECTDVDFRKDIVHTEFFKAISKLNEMSKEHKQFKKGVQMFPSKDNLGIQWSDRHKATMSHPYLKLYHKQIELTNNPKSVAFTETFLRGVDLSNRVRIEFTIKNRKHLKRMGVECQKVSSLLQLDQEHKNKMLEKIVKIHLLPRVKEVVKPKSAMTPLDLVIYNSMMMLQERDSFMSRDRLIKGLLSNFAEMKGYKGKSTMKTKLEYIYDTFIQTTTKAKELDELGNLFDALMWN